MAAAAMPQSDRHLYAHAEADVAGSSVASTPTTSRTATPTPVTPEQAGTFGMASQAGGQQSPFIVTPRARPRSSTSAASGHSGTSKESDPLAVLFASFPVPPVTEEDMLLRLERSLRLENGRNLFNLRPSNSGPPPDRPIPPLPPIRPETDSSPEVEPAKQHTDALGLALTYASQLQRTGDSGEATSSLTRRAFTPRPRSAIPPPLGPPPSIPLPRIPMSSTSLCRGERRELATGTLLAVNCSADGTDVESRTRPRSNDSQGPIIDTSGAGPQDTSDSSVYKDEDDNASLARGAQSHHSQRCADHQPASASARSSSDLEVIKADLTELLASFRPASTRAPSPRSRERSRTRSQAEAMTLSARPEPDSEETSPREINASRKSSVVSMHSFTSASSSSSAHFRTTGGYKAYKLVRKERSPASCSPTTSRRSSLSTPSTAESKPTDSDADSDELFDLSFDSTSQPQPRSERCLGSPKAQGQYGRSTGSPTTAAKGAARSGRRTDMLRRTLWASQPTTGTTSEQSPPGPHHNASESNSRALGPEEPVPTATAAAAPLRQTLIKPLITAPNAQSAYLPSSSPKSASRVPPVQVNSSSLARSLPLPRSPPGPRPHLTPDGAKASRLPRPQRRAPTRGDGTRTPKPAVLASLHYYNTDGAIAN